MQFRIHRGNGLSYLDLTYMDLYVIPKDKKYTVIIKFTHFKEDMPNCVDTIFGYGYRKYCDNVTYNKKMKVISKISFTMNETDGYDGLGKKLCDICEDITRTSGKVRNVPTRAVTLAVLDNLVKVKTYIWSVVKH